MSMRLLTYRSAITNGLATGKLADAATGNELLRRIERALTRGDTFESFYFTAIEDGLLAPPRMVAGRSSSPDWSTFGPEPTPVTPEPARQESRPVQANLFAGGLL